MVDSCGGIRARVDKQLDNLRISDAQVQRRGALGVDTTLVDFLVDILANVDEILDDFGLVL